MLEWQLRNSDKLKHLERFKALQESGQNVPFLQSVPEIDPNYFWLWEGFGVLAGQRFIGSEGIIQPIQVSEIKAYCDFVGIEDQTEREDFLRVVLALDTVAMNFSRNKMAKERQKAQQKSKGKSMPSRGRKR